MNGDNPLINQQMHDTFQTLHICESLTIIQRIRPVLMSDDVTDILTAFTDKVITQ